MASPHDSRRRYAKGTNKTMYWDHTYEDVMNLIARVPEAAALIYRCTYHDGVVPKYDKSLDYSGNFCNDFFTGSNNAEGPPARRSSIPSCVQCAHHH